MELSDVRTALRRYWLVALGVLFFWLAVGSVLAFRPASVYRATATVVIAPTAQFEGNPIQVVSFQIPAIIATLQSRTFYERVQRTLPEEIRGRGVAIAGSSDVGGGIVRVSATGQDREVLAEWATAFARAITDDQNRSQEVVRVRLLDDARTPRTPISPQRSSTMFGAFVLGLFSAVLAAVVTHRVRRALDFDDEIQRRLDLPVIGRIPAARALRRISEGEGGSLLDGPPEIVEAFQGLRTALNLAALGEGPDTFAVTSWGEGEGKSTVAAGIALMTASAGQNVIAVDADLRRPALHVRLGEPFGEGLADASRRSLDSLLTSCAQPHLWLLPAGIPDRHPTDVLAVNLPRVLEILESTKRRLILDAPPFAGIAETQMILAAASHVILVVDSRRSRLPEVERMVERLRSNGVNFVGVVLNRVPRSRRGAGYSAYVGNY